jgi:hypothetical protein
MSEATKKLIEEVDALPDPDRSEALAGLDPHDLPQDDDLLAAADRLLVDLDRREQPE